VLLAFAEPKQDKEHEQEKQVIHHYKNRIYLSGFCAEKWDAPQAGEPPNK